MIENRRSRELETMHLRLPRNSLLLDFARSLSSMAHILAVGRILDTLSISTFGKPVRTCPTSLVKSGSEVARTRWFALLAKLG
jgi:hypothetical protein